VRIAIYHNLPSGGAKRAVYEWVRRLVTEHTIDVYSLSTADHAFCDIRSFISKHKVYEFSPRGLFKSPFGRLNQMQRWQDLGDLDGLQQKIAREINTGNYDIFFANTCAFTFVPAILKYVDIPSVYYLHEPFGPGMERIDDRTDQPSWNWRDRIDRYDPFFQLYWNRLHAIQRQSVEKVSRLLANSHFTAQCNQAVFGRESIFCPLGVDLNDFQPVPGSPREEFVLSVGEMSLRKGFDFIIESLAKIPANRRPPLKLACNAVKPRELDYINELAGRCQVDVQVLYKLDKEKLRDYYSRARLCVYTPINEPFGLVPLEAMACGTPVVGVREGGVMESIVHEHTGLLVERDPDRFAAAVQSLLANPDLADAYGRNAREHVTRNWSWDHSVKLLSSNLKSTCLN
jgi:glycosyltransferase involved in cell wall biosynthesis